MRSQTVLFCTSQLEFLSHTFPLQVQTGMFTWGGIFLETKISCRPGWPEAHHLADDDLWLSFRCLPSSGALVWAAIPGYCDQTQPFIHARQPFSPLQGTPRPFPSSDVLCVLPQWVLFVVILRQFFNMNQIVYLREFRKLYQGVFLVKVLLYTAILTTGTQTL